MTPEEKLRIFIKALASLAALKLTCEHDCPCEDKLDWDEAYAARMIAAGDRYIAALTASVDAVDISPVA